MIRPLFFRPSSLSTSLIVLVAFALALPASARVHVVRNGESIQAAVDQAQPGDTVLIKPGVYTPEPGSDYVFTVNTDDITIRGSKHAVIDAHGYEYGIMVGEEAVLGPEPCPPITVRNFRLQGLTVRNATESGVHLVGVDGFSLTHTRYLDNGEYGPFPVCSRNGRIAHNFASGHIDAAIYVGDDENVVLEHNIATGNTIGLEVNASNNIIVRRNRLVGNTSGLLVITLPFLPLTGTEDVLIRGNWIVDNNFPNPIPPDAGVPLALIPTGSGILMAGGDRITIERNVIAHNDSSGISMIADPFALFDPRHEPFPDDNVVRDNVILLNGTAPDPDRALSPGADIVFIPHLIDLSTGTVIQFDPDPTDNCFDGNAFDTDFPTGVVASLPCE